MGAQNEDSGATGVNGDQGDNSASGSGAVYVFARSDAGAWKQQAYLKASNTEENDNFGYSVSFSGGTLAVGAPYEDSGATGLNGDQDDDSASSGGAVYVFVRDEADAWMQQAYLKGSNTDSRDSFGFSVSLHGDTIAVGAYYEASGSTGVNGDQFDNSASDSGAAYARRIAP